MANWLTFALSPMEMMKSPEHPHFVSYDDDSSAPYLIDNLYVLKEEAETSMADSTALASFFNPQTHSPTHIPKLEDFLGDSSSSSFVRFPDNHPETLDSSSLYHPRHHTGVTGLFSDHQHDDFQAVEGGVKEGCTKEGALSLAVNNTDGERVKSSRKVTVSKKEAKAVETTSTDDSTKKKKKVVESFGQRTSIYRGVTRVLIDADIDGREDTKRIFGITAVGGKVKPEKDVRIASYSKELEEMNHMTKQEFIASIRRKSSGFSRGASMYRGVTRHHQQGRWQARIGRVAGNKDLYLGTFATEEEAAEAYDIAAIKFRGINAVTNFEMNRYDVEAIMNSSFPVGGSAVKRHKQLSLESPPPPTDDHNIQQLLLPSSSVELDPNSIPCGIPFDPSVLYHPQNFFQHYPDPTVPMNQADQFFMWSNQSY
ncbi:hypothetical protein YC2023_073129 [Brassica napus]